MTSDDESGSGHQGARYLVLDVGGSGIKYATASAEGELGPRATLPTAYTTHEEFIDAVVGIVDRSRPVDGIAISTCGELDPHTGHMFSGGTLTFNAGTNFVTALEARCGLRTTVENDANCALVAEMRDGALAEYTSGVVVVLGSGVGGAIMVDRKVFYGSHFHAGNLSFLHVDLERPDERILGLSTGFASLLESYRAARHGEPDIASGKDFFERLADGSPAAAQSLSRYAAKLASLIFNLQVVLDVEAVAIGGGISAQPALIEAIEREVERRFDDAPVPLPRPVVTACRYRNDANLLGALWHHLKPSASAPVPGEPG